MTKKEELTFHPKYVAPFYGGLMNYNLLRQSEPSTFLNDVRALGRKLDDEFILALLNDSWRPSKVGAWIIGLSKKYHLERDLVNYLSTRPIYCEHAIIALTILNSEKSPNSIKEYTKSQLDFILVLLQKSEYSKATEILERHRIVYGLGALKYLDKINGTNFYQEVGKESNEWILIKRELQNISKEKPRLVNLNEAYINGFESTTTITMF